MKDRFEHKLLTAKIVPGKERQSLLNELGREGWEAVSHSVFPRLDGSGADLCSVILKRALG